MTTQSPSPFAKGMIRRLSCGGAAVAVAVVVMFTGGEGPATGSVPSATSSLITTPTPQSTVQTTMTGPPSHRALGPYTKATQPSGARPVYTPQTPRGPAHRSSASGWVQPFDIVLVMFAIVAIVLGVYLWSRRDALLKRRSSRALRRSEASMRAGGPGQQTPEHVSTALPLTGPEAVVPDAVHEESSDHVVGPRLGLPERLGRNIVATYGATAVVSLSTLVVIPLLVHRLGLATYGVWALVSTIAGYVTLSDLGISNATTKFIAEHADSDPSAVITIFNTNFFALCGLALIALAGGLGLAVVAPYLFHVPQADRASAFVAFAVVAASVALTLPIGTYFGLLSGYQRYDLIGLCNSVTGTASAIVSGSIVLAGGGLVALALGAATTSAATLVLPVALARRLVPGLRVRRRYVDRATLRRTASLSVWYTVQNIASVIGLQIDLVVVGALIGVDAVALYAVGLKLGQLADKGVGPLQQVFFPHASAMSVREDARQQLAAILIDGTRAVVAVAMPISLVLLFLAFPAVHAWVGNGYHVSAEVVMVIGGITAVGSLTTAAWQLLSGLGQARLAAFIGLADALVNLCVSIALAHVLGAVGVALGTLASVLFVNLPLIIIFTARRTGVGVIEWARHSLVSHLVPAVLTTAALAIASRLVTGRPVPVLLAAAATFVVYEAAFLCFGAVPAEKARLLSELSGAWRFARRLALKGLPK